MAHLLQIAEPVARTPVRDTQACVVGIDLGTTHSVVAVVRDGGAQVIKDAYGETLVPSIVDLAGDNPRVGRAAMRSLMAIRSIKRQMGASDEITRNHAVTVSAHILEHMKRRAQDHVGAQNCQAVITVPAYFDDVARAATRDAAQKAGIHVLRLINEPTAAALAYGLDKGVSGLYAVYDLGGGTFDFSLLNLCEGIFQVLATGGDVQLGGDDIDHALARHFLKGDTDLSQERWTRAVQDARTAKEALSTQEIYPGDQSAQTLARTTLEDLARPFVARTLVCVANVLRDAGKAPAEIAGVVLVGGATRMPLVIESVRSFFHKEPLRDIDPDHAVAQGAAHQAHALTQGASALLLDVTPLSLGVETAGGLVDRVIERNTPLPACQVQNFTTARDGQTAMQLHIVQGERELASDCRSLGSFTLSGIPPMIAGRARIAVTFTLDVSGLLTVCAQEQTTGQQAQTTINATRDLDDQRITQMLLEAHLQGQEDMIKRMLAEGRAAIDRLIYVVEKALAQDGALLDKQAHAHILQALEKARIVGAGGDVAAMDAARADLENACADFAQRRINAGIQQALHGRRIDEIKDVLGF